MTNFTENNSTVHNQPRAIKNNIIGTGNNIAVGLHCVER